MPVSLEDVVETKYSLLPDFVIEAFNTLIARNYSNGRVIVLQKM